MEFFAPIVSRFPGTLFRCCFTTRCLVFRYIVTFHVESFRVLDTRMMLNVGNWTSREGTFMYLILSVE